MRKSKIDREGQNKSQKNDTRRNRTDQTDTGNGRHQTQKEKKTANISNRGIWLIAPIMAK